MTDAATTTIVLTKTTDGKFEAVGHKAREAWALILAWWKGMQPGESFSLRVMKPRNPKFHGLHFAMLNRIFEAQDQFDDEDKLRAWLQVGAGYADFVPGPRGRMVAIPHSIAWHRMDDIPFTEHHKRVKDFLRSGHATRFLWPHLEAHVAAEMVESILVGFER